ncbi:iron-containing redox enzyme family protein [Desmonostoc muscorum]|uniref:iron-containing redox enzyme family protein n=1 Tax=Desmonostoc muscorum TaxID=1179 RepID=UPI0028153D67|nr:iron-containing redox enzyme family protein [Desmonostoc muscorum]
MATTNRVWLHQLNGDMSSDRFAQLMNHPGNIVTTRKLLDGALEVAQKAALANNKLPNLTLTRWIWRLASLYHLTHSTPRLMAEAAQRFALAGRARLADWALQKAAEERGHDQLALLDIQSLGYKASAVVKVLVPPTASALVNYFTQSVQTTDPIACVGYSYAMERLAMSVGDKYIQAVQALLPSDINATRCLRLHSGVGSDVAHVEETVEMVAKLTPQERVQVTTACYETALLCFSPPREGYISDAELQHLLQPLKLTTSSK